MFCIHCGKEIDDDSLFCPICGKNQNYQDVLTYDFTNKGKKGFQEKERLLFLWWIIYFIVFPYGIIDFFIKRKKRPRRAICAISASLSMIILLLIASLTTLIILLNK